MHKAGFVNIVGNPNVGKSTLMNSLVGERISIITSKAQTTRHRIMGIVNTEDMQIVYSDTPGVLVPNYKLQESMLNFSQSALLDADILLYVTDVVEAPAKQPTIAFVRKQEKTHLFRQKMRLSYISTNLFCVVSPNEIKSSPCKSCAKSREDKFISFFEFIFKIPEAEWESAGTSVTVSFDVDHDLFDRNFQTLCYGGDNTLISLMRNYPVDVFFA